MEKDKMKRTVFAVIALLMSCLICVFGLSVLVDTCEEMTEQLELLSSTAKSNKVEEAVEMTEEIIALWEEAHEKIEVFIPHEETDELEEIINSLPIYAKQGNMERLEERTEMAIIRLEHLIKSEKPSLSNIF